MTRAQLAFPIWFTTTALAVASCSGGDASTTSSTGATNTSTSAAGGGTSSSSSGSGAAGGGEPSSPRCPTVAQDADVMQALPKEIIDASPVAATGATIKVAAGGDLKAALAQAKPGDVIELAAGASFEGPFNLPKKDGAGWITIRTSTPDADLPAAGTRVDPTLAPKLARISAPANQPAFQTDLGAHHYRLLGLEIAPDPGAYTYNLVLLGAGGATDADRPHDFVIDRSYLHGDATLGTRRGVALNAARVAIVDSWFADFKEQGADSQAIAGWDGPGPFTILNNHLEGAAENIIFGGADPSAKDLVPSDITICGNHIVKPVAWKSEKWSVKNLVELKNAHRVLLAGNVIEYNWLNGQVGFAILLTPRNQDGGCPWCGVADVTVAYNAIRHTGSAFNVSGEDDNHPSTETARVVIHDNIIEDVNSAMWGGDGRGFQVVTPNKPTLGLKIDHNTVPMIGNAFLVMGDTNPVATPLIFTNNVVAHGNYGAFGSGKGEGNGGLSFYAPGATFSKNAIVGGGDPSSYPPDNTFPATLAQATGTGTDGKPIGADKAAVDAATAAVGP